MQFPFFGEVGRKRGSEEGQEGRRGMGEEGVWGQREEWGGEGG